MHGIGKVLIITGTVIMVLGLVFIFHEHIPWLGKLPGDISIKKGNSTFHFLLVTSILLSVVLTIVINLILRIMSK